MRQNAELLTGGNRHQLASNHFNKGKKENVRAGIATDHGEFSLKEDLVARLRAAESQGSLCNRAGIDTGTGAICR